MIPAMTPECVHKYLEEIGYNSNGKGIIIELGCWLGACTAALLRGLNAARNRRGIKPVTYYCYDRWKATKQEVIKAKEAGVKIEKGQNLLPVFFNNVDVHLSMCGITIVAKRGSIAELEMPSHPIEICLFDAPKRDPLFTQMIKKLSPYWIPNMTVLGLLDYYWYRNGNKIKNDALLAQKRFIESHPGSFTLLKDWPDICDCAFFQYNGGFRYENGTIVFPNEKGGE